MQHLVNDVNVRPCDMEAARSEGRLPPPPSTCAAANVVEEKVRALEMRRDAAREEINVMRRALEKLKEIDPSLTHSLDGEVIKDYVETASTALKRHATKRATSSNADGVGAYAQMKRRPPHDELR